MLKVLLLLTMGCALVFIAPILGMLTGGFAGWVVGLFFPHTLRLLIHGLGLGDAQAWQLGAMLGFVGGFFRASVSGSAD